MECTAEIDGNEINLAQMWSLFCLWGFETSLQSFKFPCNLEIKEFSKMYLSPLPVAITWLWYYRTEQQMWINCIWNECVIAPYKMLSYIVYFKNYCLKHSFTNKTIT